VTAPPVAPGGGIKPVRWTGVADGEPDTGWERRRRYFDRQPAVLTGVGDEVLKRLAESNGVDEDILFGGHPPKAQLRGAEQSAPGLQQPVGRLADANCACGAWRPVSVDRAVQIGERAYRLLKNIERW
jgi:hypothetical protein